MTDIVDTLRALRERHSYLDWSERLTEAADEIERLRTHLAELEHQRDSALADLEKWQHAHDRQEAE